MSRGPAGAARDAITDNKVGVARAGAAYLRFLKLGLGILACSGACGNVAFVDAPFAPRQIDVIYSAQEDVTVVRWRVSATETSPAVGFDLLDASGHWQPIDFAASIYPGGIGRCGTGSGLCAQTVLAGRYQPPTKPAANAAAGAAPSPLRSRNPTYGTSPGDAPTLYNVDQTLVLGSYFQRGNATLAASIADVIGADTTFVFPRQLEKSVWERRGVCVPGFHPADAQFDPVEGLKKDWPAPAPLSAVGQYCASVRAVMSNGDRGIDEPIAVDTLPEVSDGDHLYTVPTELTPFSYQIVLDLSIPVVDRCQEAIRTIQSTVAQSLGMFSKLRSLPVIDLSAGIDPETGAPGIPCRQSELRTIDVTAVAQQIKLAAASWPEQHQRFFLIYFNNLRAALPDPLIQSLDEFRATILPTQPVDFRALLWAFGPDEMTSSYGGWDLPSTPWLSATDPQLAVALDNFGGQSLPLISEIQPPDQPVPILSNDDARAFDGGFLRLCETSVAPLAGSGSLQLVQHDSNGQLVYLPPLAPQIAVHANDPPAYLLNVPAVWAVSAVGFVPHAARIRYEICTRYCDHPFQAESGAPVATGWIGSNLCMGPPGGAG